MILKSGSRLSHVGEIIIYRTKMVNHKSMVVFYQRSRDDLDKSKLSMQVMFHVKRVLT